MATSKKSVDTVVETTVAPAPAQSQQDVLMAAFIEYLKQNKEAIDRQTDALKPKPVDAITPEYLAAQNREFNRPAFHRPVFQNSYAANCHGLSDAILDKVDALKSGVYMGGVVRVVEDKDSITLLYKNKTDAERWALRDHFSSFSDLVNKLYDEMKARETADKK